jgi:WD40 repeat protein
VAVSPDGHTLATSTAKDGAIRLWDLTDPAHPRLLSQPLTGSTYGVSSMVFSPDGHTLASSDGDTIRLWDITNPASPRPLGQTPPGGDTGLLAFSPDGHTLADGGYDGTVQLWNITDRAHAHSRWSAAMCSTGFSVPGCTPGRCRPAGG